MGPAGIALAIVGGLLGVTVAAGGVMYATDYRVDATVQETRCDLLQVKVRTKLLGLDHTVKDVPAQQCGVLEPGNFVQYRLRSQRTTLYDHEGGRCLYDSETGAYCGERGAMGGGLGLP